MVCACIIMCILLFSGLINTKSIYVMIVVFKEIKYIFKKKKKRTINKKNLTWSVNKCNICVLNVNVCVWMFVLRYEARLNLSLLGWCSWEEGQEQRCRDIRVPRTLRWWRRRAEKRSMKIRMMDKHCRDRYVYNFKSLSCAIEVYVKKFPFLEDDWIHFYPYYIFLLYKWILIYK